MLIIDDNAQARNVLSGMLRIMAFVVDEAASGQEGVEMVRGAVDRGEPYEIAFVDWQMPGLDGIETGKRILTADQWRRLRRISSWSPPMAVRKC